jgi:hypothetical protein
MLAALEASRHHWHYPAAMSQKRWRCASRTARKLSLPLREYSEHHAAQTTDICAIQKLESPYGAPSASFNSRPVQMVSKSDRDAAKAIRTETSRLEDLNITLSEVRALARKLEASQNAIANVPPTPEDRPRVRPRKREIAGWVTTATILLTVIGLVISWYSAQLSNQALQRAQVSQSFAQGIAPCPRKTKPSDTGKVINSAGSLSVVVVTNDGRLPITVVGFDDAPFASTIQTKYEWVRLTDPPGTKPSTGALRLDVGDAAVVQLLVPGYKFKFPIGVTLSDGEVNVPLNIERDKYHMPKAIESIAVKMPVLCKTILKIDSLPTS